MPCYKLWVYDRTGWFGPGFIKYLASYPGGGGPLVSEVGYHPRKKIHVIRVVFQDKAMYARTSFRGAKTCKMGKKGMFFGHIDKFLNGHDAQIKKNASKNAYLGSIFSYFHT